MPKVIIFGKKKPKMRLGFSENDADDLKKHIFFQGLDWNLLQKKLIKPPWIPVIHS